MFNKDDVLGKYKGYTVTKCLGKKGSTYNYEVLFDDGSKVIRTRNSIKKGLSLPKPKKKRVFTETKSIEDINKRYNLNSCLVIDQSSICSGYSIIIGGNIVEFGLIRNIGDNPYKRNHSLIKKIGSLVTKYNIESIVLENIFLGSNVHTYNVLSSTIATIAYYCIDNNIALSLISNPYWTSILGISGTRELRKKQSISIAKNFDSSIKDDNVSDSVCMALALIERRLF